MTQIIVEIDNEEQKYEYEEAIIGYPVLNVNTDELGIIEASQLNVFDAEVERMEKFTPYMGCMLKQESDEEKEKERIYRTHAVLLTYQEFLDAVNDDAASDEIVNNLEAKINEKQEKLKTGAIALPKQHSINHTVHSEVLRVKGKDMVTGARMVRVRSERIRNHNRWFNRNQVKQQLAKENRENNAKADASKKKPITSVEMSFFKKEIWKEDGSLNDSIQNFNKDCKNEFFTDNAILSSDVNAQFLRYSTAAVAEGKAVWSKEKIDVSIGAKADASFAAASASGTFKVELPNEHGFGLMQFFKKEEPKFVDDDFTEVFLKVVMETTGNAFVGACASVSTDLGLTCNPGKGQTDVKAQAGVELFAGAKAQAEATFAIDTMFVDDDKMDKMREQTQTVAQRGDEPISAKDIEAQKLAKWERLGSATTGGYVAYGVGVDATFKFGYEEKRFRYQAKIGATVKLGAGTFLKGEVAPVLVGKFILTIANGFNWKNISSKLTDSTYQLYQGLMANCFYTGEKIDDVYKQIAGNIDQVMINISDVAISGLGAIKGVDDYFDENIPGYTSYKQYSLQFIVLKSTYEYLKRLNKDLTLKEAAIQMVEKAEQDTKRWNYATWQMKVNLIYDMRHGGSGWFGGFSEERKEDAVIAVLENCRNSDEFKKVESNLKDPEKVARRESVFIDDLVDFSQQSKLDYLRKVKFL